MERDRERPQRIRKEAEDNKAERLFRGQWVGRPLFGSSAVNANNAAATSCKDLQSRALDA